MTTPTPRVFVLPEALKAHRERLNYSQKVLADRSGVSLGLVGLIETGERQPRLGNAQAIAEALGTTVESFALVLDDPTLARLRRVMKDHTVTETAAA
jgi:transcriptional regulator with XRE-family HTH domain